MKKKSKQKPAKNKEISNLGRRLLIGVMFFVCILAVATVAWALEIERLYSFYGIKEGTVQEVKYNDHNEGFTVFVKIDDRDYQAYIYDETEESVKKIFYPGAKVSFSYSGNTIHVTPVYK